MITDELVRRAILSARRLDDLVLPEIGGWQYIAETALTAGAASVTFASIPQIYKALVMLTQARTDRAATLDIVKWQANGDAGNNYDRIFIQGTLAGAVSSGGTLATTDGYVGNAEAANSRADNFAAYVCYWIGYALADREKFSITVGGWRISDAVAANTAINMWGGHWRNTNAITSLTIFPSVGPNFVSGSRFLLYGIL